MSKLVPMAKDGETLFVHPSTVAEHQRLGWSVSAAQPAASAHATAVPSSIEPAAPQAVEPPSPVQPPPQAEDRESITDDAPVVEIPAGWKDLKWFSMKALAANFTDQPIENKPDAEKVIEAELERRSKS